ncbi:hypothetical protein [Hydrogenophaga sp. 2FB]|uniref:hypothetical protein n=1 Tax=Hydrogenophaga sp. 2FB TaxID=2502187 RepID=UPI001BB29A86|nr:hypothetical protein [Hydrogenophaga sp. 2FB]
MTRQAVRQHKHAVRSSKRPGAQSVEQQKGAEGALALLDRSVRFGHSRLALIRLEQAINCGAPVSVDHWKYCYSAAMSSADVNLQALYLRAAQKVS